MPVLGHSGYRPRKDGERKRKSVRGCIVGPDLSALDLVIVKKGDAELPGITDKYVPRRLGPKRASKIRKLFVSPLLAYLLPSTTTPPPPHAHSTASHLAPPHTPPPTLSSRHSISPSLPITPSSPA